MAQRSSNPTVAEKVGRGAIAEPRVRAYGYTEYDERRPGYVSSNPRAGAEWGALANALDDFYKSSTRAYTKYKENQIETGIANSSIATDFARETYGEQANKMAFKELVEKHPEFANDNPWVEVGYEQARLRELGMEAKSGLAKYLDETGAFNAEDPAVFQQSVNTYFKGFREQTGLSSYDDKVLVSKWFSPVEAEARKQVTAQYDAVIRNGRQDKLANQTASNIATHIRLALDEGRAIDFKAVGAEIKMATDNGLLNIKTPEVALNGIKVAYSQTEDRDVLELVKQVEVNGVKLIDTPAGAKWYEVEIDTLNAKATKQSKKEADDEVKFYGPDGSSLTHYYAYNMGTKEFPNQEAVIADYEKRTGINLNLAQEHELISDIRKIRNESIKNSNAFASAGNNPRLIAEAKNGIILSSASASEASSRFWKMYDDTGIEEYKKTAESLMNKEGDAHWQAIKDTSKKADEALKSYAEDIVKTFVAGVTANAWNKNRLTDDVSERIKSDYMELYSSNLIRLTEENSSSKIQVSSASLSATASAEALNIIKERVGAQYYTAGIDPTKYAQDARTLSKYNASIPSELADSEPDVQARVVWTDTADGFLLSPNNTGIRKTQISSLANMLDVARMAGDNVSISKPEDVLPYIIYNPTEPVSGSMLLGGKMVFQLSQPVNQDVIDSLEARMRILFPNISGFDYVVSVQTKITSSEADEDQDSVNEDDD